MMGLPLLTSTFAFETVAVDTYGQLSNRERREGHYIRESLPSGVFIDMAVLPSGSAQIGSPLTETARIPNEDEPHWVDFASFCISKYPIGQAQWRAVAALPKVSRELSPMPAKFTSLNRPVENVSWDDAIEFCERLSIAVQKPYRLPTEAEWEYACRAGSTTPFSHGEALAPELANYCADTSEIPPNQQTTAIDAFTFANAFGLYDMHGNVREWCLFNPWQEHNPEKCRRPLRGGGWIDSMFACRSAFRLIGAIGTQNAYTGFRVVYHPAELTSKTTQGTQISNSQSLIVNSPNSTVIVQGDVSQGIGLSREP